MSSHWQKIELKLKNKTLSTVAAHSSWTSLKGKLWQCGDVPIRSAAGQHRRGGGCEETPTQHRGEHSRLRERDRDSEIPAAREHCQVQRRLLQCRYSLTVIRTFFVLMFHSGWFRPVQKKHANILYTFYLLQMKYLPHAFVAAWSEWLGFFLASRRKAKSPSHHGISALWKSTRLPHEKQGEDRPQKACALLFTDLQGPLPVLICHVSLCCNCGENRSSSFYILCSPREWSTCQVNGISTGTWQHEIFLWRVSKGWKLEILALPKFCLRTKNTTWWKSLERVPYSG